MVWRWLARILRVETVPVARAMVPTVVVSAPDVAAKRMAPTVIVLLGLCEVMLVGFWVGCETGSMHPIWKVIEGMAAVAALGLLLRLAGLARSRRGQDPGREMGALHGAGEAID